MRTAFVRLLQLEVAHRALLATLRSFAGAALG